MIHFVARTASQTFGPASQETQNNYMIHGKPTIYSQEINI